jgi:hypothetical protein
MPEAQDPEDIKYAALLGYFAGTSSLLRRHGLHVQRCLQRYRWGQNIPLSLREDRGPDFRYVKEMFFTSKSSCVLENHPANMK